MLSESGAGSFVLFETKQYCTCEEGKTAIDYMLRCLTLSSEHARFDACNAAYTVFTLIYYVPPESVYCPSGPCEHVSCA